MKKFRIIYNTDFHYNASAIVSAENREEALVKFYMNYSNANEVKSIEVME